MNTDPTNVSANDDMPPPENAVPFSDIVMALGVDENTLLQRLAKILSRREEGHNNTANQIQQPIQE